MPEERASVIGDSPVFIINFKNYPEILGNEGLGLVRAAERASSLSAVRLIVAPPVPMLGAVAAVSKVPVFSQKVESGDEGKSTGAVIPESVKAAGCSGSLLNHSESRVPFVVMAELLPRMKKLGLATCLCAESPAEVSSFAPLEPEFIAIEPPELIGTGVAVSKARPEVVTGSVSAARKVGYRGMVLCGAGIVTREDAAAAMRLGAQGILVASSVVKAKSDWEGKLRELSDGLVSGR